MIAYYFEIISLNSNVLIFIFYIYFVSFCVVWTTIKLKLKSGLLFLQNRKRMRPTHKNHIFIKLWYSCEFKKQNYFPLSFQKERTIKVFINMKCYIIYYMPLCRTSAIWLSLTVILKCGRISILWKFKNFLNKFSLSTHQTFECFSLVI